MAFDLVHGRKIGYVIAGTICLALLFVGQIWIENIFSHQDRYQDQEPSIMMTGGKRVVRDSVIKWDRRKIIDWLSWTPALRSLFAKHKDSDYLDGLKEMDLDVFALERLGPTSSTADKQVLGLPKTLFSNSKSATNDDNVDVSEDDLKIIKIGARFAAISYCLTENIMNWKCPMHCNVEETAGTLPLAYIFGKETDTVGYVAVQPKNLRIIVSFRGSITLRNWVNNLLVTKSFIPWSESGDQDVQVHAGFLRTYNAVRSQIHTTLIQAIQDYVVGNPEMENWTILITGHSLGGALAVLCTLDIQRNLLQNPSSVINRDLPHSQLPVINLVTVGEPRVGNEKFARFFSETFSHDNNWKNVNGTGTGAGKKVMFKTSLKRNPFSKNNKMYRVTNGNDVVPHLPPRRFAFRHHTTEMWFKPGSTKKFQIGKGDESKREYKEKKISLSESKNPLFAFHEPNSNQSTIVKCDDSDGEDPDCSNSLVKYLGILSHLQIDDVLFGPFC